MIPITATTGKMYFMNILANPMVRLIKRPRTHDFVGDRRLPSGRGGRVLLDIDDMAIVHVGDPVAELEDAVIVSDDGHGPVGPDGGLAEQLHHGDSRLVVERSGRL